MYSNTIGHRNSESENTEKIMKYLAIVLTGISLSACGTTSGVPYVNGPYGGLNAPVYSGQDISPPYMKNYDPNFNPALRNGGGV